jgi:hypothetical protein
MRITFILALALFLVSCSEDQKKIFSTENLPSQNFTINISKDTTILTEKGTWLDIPKGSIVADGENVSLEIKEAFSLADMIKGGLTTESNGQPLSSGGMIYINANENARIVKPIRIATPSGFLEKDMQLFRGDTADDGKINWVEPKPLPPNEQLAMTEYGRQVFQASCQSCHFPGKLLVGPDLAHIEKRFNYDGHGIERLKLFSHAIFFNTSEMLPSDSTQGLYPTVKELLYACQLSKQFGGTTGPVFPSLKHIDWAAISNYLQSESNRLNLLMPAQDSLWDCMDSCEVYLKLRTPLDEQRGNATTERTQKIDDNGEMSEFNNTMPPFDTNGFEDTFPAGQPAPVKDRVEPKNYQSQYYQFSIESFGWYNIDVLVKDMEGVIDSELFVTLTGKYTDRVNLYLIIPSRKINVEGGPSEKGENEYAFFTKDGKIPLPAGVNCYILAVSEANDELAYAIKSFSAASSQRFDIELQKTTKEAFNKAMEIFNDKTFSVKVKDAKNATDIRKLDSTLKNIDERLKEAEKLKPKNCDCNCGEGAVTDTTKDSQLFSGDVVR